MSIEKQKEVGQIVETETLANDFETKMELERAILEYDCGISKITEEEWVKFYGESFDEICKDPTLHILERFKSKEVYDNDPQEFYKEVQNLLIEKFTQKQKEDEDLVEYM